MGGYVGQFRPMTQKEILDAVNRHTHQALRYEAEVSARHVFFNEFNRLKEENGRVYSQLQQRINDRVGKQGPFSAAVNSALDSVLGKFVGKNSASKIIRGLTISLT
jgi:hypothetical protein